MKPLKIKRKYDVYLLGIGDGCYARDFYREYLGQTFAYSEEQAINNIRFRTKRKEYELGDYAEQGSVSFTYSAVLSEN